MGYARVHDHTVAEDYLTAMEQVEHRLSLATRAENTGKFAFPGEIGQLTEREYSTILSWARSKGAAKNDVLGNGIFFPRISAVIILLRDIS